MITKEEFHTEELWGQLPDPIFLKMLQNMPDTTLAPLTESRQEGEKSILVYAISNLISIETLLETRRFNMRLFRHLLISIDTLSVQLDQYMLSINMLIYSENRIYFDATTDRFVWILLPLKRDEKIVQREQLQFFRHLLVELEQCHISEINTLLVKAHFSLISLQSYFQIQRGAVSPNHATLKVKDKEKNMPFWEQVKLKLSEKSKPQKKLKSTDNLTPPFTTQQSINLKKTAYIQRHPILLSRDQPEIQYKIYYETCLIGRDDRCELCIDDTSISREHAKLYTQNGQFLIEDLGSTNGTMVNNEKIQTKTILCHGDEVRIGHCDFIFLK